MNTKLFIAIMKDNSRRGQLIANLMKGIVKRKTLKETANGKEFQLLMICKLIFKIFILRGVRNEEVGEGGIEPSHSI